MAIITKAEVKEFIGVTESDDDTLIDNLIIKMEASEQKRINRAFEVDDYTEYYDGDNTPDLLVDHYPINSTPANIGLYDDTERAYGVDTKVDAADIIIYSEEGKITLDGGHFSKSNQNIKVVYNAGYEANDMPAEIKQALVKVVAAEYLYGKGSVEAIEGEAFPRPDKLKKTGQEELNMYARDILR